MVSIQEAGFAVCSLVVVTLMARATSLKVAIHLLILLVAQRRLLVVDMSLIAGLLNHWLSDLGHKYRCLDKLNFFVLVFEATCLLDISDNI